MSAPWWTIPGAPSRMVPFGPDGVQPQLVDPTARAHLLELIRRAPAFVPEWQRSRGDAGDVLVRLFGAQLQPLLERINRLPEKTFVEFLRIAGIEQLPGGTASALIMFEATQGAPQSAFVPQRFQIGAQPADSSPGLVVFETLRDVNVVPGSIAQAAVQQGRALITIAEPTSGTTFRPFGDRAIAGRALLIGIDSPIAPAPTLSLGIAVASPPGAPPPVSAGGVAPAPVALPPLLQWEVLDGASFTPAEVIVDETAGLSTSGIVELQPPRIWRRGRPAGANADSDLFWIRVRIVHGAYASPPELSRLMLNAARVEAAETIRGETLEPVPGTTNRMQLARTPVVPDSLVLEIQEGVATGDLLDLDVPGEPSGVDGDAVSPAGAAAADASGVRRWTEVADLSVYGPNDRVFTLDPRSGELTFGDGHHGATLPRGFRHVQAARYRVGGGARGAVAEEQIETLIHSAPFLVGATNPLRASGGTDIESRDAAIRRGPEEIRARNRAVTERDYELLARRASGASVARAHAVSGLHPVLPGAPIPGVVGVFVVPADRVEGPPVADAQTCRAVAEFLANHVAPAGVEVVVAAPRFHRIRAEVRVQIADPAADAGDTVRRVIEALNLYFDPIRGGDDEAGWVFGGAIRYIPLLRRLLSRVPSASAIPRLNLLLDGVRFPSCADVPLSPHALLWPETHEVTLEASEERR